MINLCFTPYQAYFSYLTSVDLFFKYYESKIDICILLLKFSLHSISMKIENYMRPRTQVSAYRCLRMYARVSPCILPETFKLDSKSVRLTSSIGSGVLPKCLLLCSLIVFKVCYYYLENKELVYFYSDISHHLKMNVIWPSTLQQ